VTPEQLARQEIDRQLTLSHQQVVPGRCLLGVAAYVTGKAFGRLVAAGKPKMQPVGACMRKLVMICNGVLKNHTPLDPNWGSKKAP
jgi:hypothetical protein